MNFIQNTFNLPKRIVRRVEHELVRPKYNGKVFCLGFNKTGTTSFGEAMKLMGYRHSSFNTKVWRKHYQKNDLISILKYTAKFDSLDDLPWLKEDMIPVLDKAFPNSKFVYLERNENSWKTSMYNWTYHMTGKYPDMEQKLKEYKEHRAFVFEYFDGRSPKEFITLDISQKNAIETLATFLNCPKPSAPMPHANKTPNIVSSEF